ncbi:MAG: HAD-IA family hydrolase [Magnetospirillum sp. WYHS-4]
MPTILERQPRLAVFDCDGTLVDSQASIVAAMHAAFLGEGRAAPEPHAVRRVVGLPLYDAIFRLLPDGDHGACAILTERYKEAFSDLRTRDVVHEPLFPGVEDVLARLDAEGWLLGVATGKSYRGLVNTLKTHGLEGRFVTLQTADRVRGKPHPDMMLQALAETGVEATCSVVIGDTTYDMEMARAAGTFAVGAAWGYHERSELTAAGAHRIADAFPDIPATILSVMGAAS